MQRQPTRREALAWFGTGAAAAALPAAAWGQQPPAFPKGAVIRTVLKDYAPEDLAGSATLFHEHLSLRKGFLEDWGGFSAATRRADARPSAPPPALAPGRPPPTERPRPTRCPTKPSWFRN